MSANGHDGNPRPDLFNDRRAEGRRMAPYGPTPLAAPRARSLKHGGKVLSGNQTAPFDPERHGPGRIASPLVTRFS